MVCAALLALAACSEVVTDAGPDAGEADAAEPEPDADLTVDPLTAPQVTGETSAGHARPTWTWTVPGGATSFQYRVDQGAWVTAALATTRYTASADLADGAHVFEVAALDGDSNAGDTGSFTTTIERFSRAGTWDGVERDLHVTPYGHEVVVQCHNCYVESTGGPASVTATLDRIHAAQTDGADAIELDVKVEGGTWRIDHDDDGTVTGAPLVEVLADAALRAGDQLLVIEVKETGATGTDMRALADLIFEAGFAANGRPVVVMGFEGVQPALQMMRGAVTEASDPFHVHYVRYDLIVGGTATPATFHAKLDTLAAAGWNGVGIDHTSPNLFGAIRYAQHLGLGVTVWTITWDAYCAAFRDEVDTITTDFSVATCGAIIEDSNGLARLDVAQHDAAGGQVTYHGASTGQSYQRTTTGTADQPSLFADGTGEDRYGTSLSFAAAELDHISLHDADNGTADGYLVAMVVNFDTMAVAEGATAALLNKSDSGGFALELYRPAGQAATFLRYGVHIAGNYQYATYDIAGLNGNDSYFIVAGYDGNGAVRLWVNGTQGTPSAGFTAGVTANASPIVIAADPQGATATRFHWGGLVQLAVVQNWANH